MRICVLKILTSRPCAAGEARLSLGAQGWCGFGRTGAKPPSPIALWAGTRVSDRIDPGDSFPFGCRYTAA